MAFSLLPLCGVNMRGEEIRYSHTNYERCSPGAGNGAALALIDPLQISAIRVQLAAPAWSSENTPSKVQLPLRACGLDPELWG